VKIDVEGLEPLLLKSGLATLIETSPLLMVEVLDENAELRALLPELISALDARAFAMGKRTLAPVDASAFEPGPLYEKHGTWDYLIVPSRHLGLIAGLIQARVPAPL
jgi:hypothetical protein